MDDASISAVVSEITPLIVGRSPGKIFHLSQHSFAIDFGLRGDGFLFISVEPASPRLYLIKRRVRDLEKQSLSSNQFVLMLKKELSETLTTGFTKLAHERIVRFEFESTDDAAPSTRRTLVAQLTGRSANLVLLDEDDVILFHSREGRGPGQTIGEKYQSPPQAGVAPTKTETPTLGIRAGQGKSVSETLDDHYQTLAAEQAAHAQLAAARAKLRKEISRRKKLLKQLENDLAEHVDAEQHKRLGDLLLANVSTARRERNRVALIDYFADGAPEIEVDVDENLTLPEEASRRFEMYARSKRARKQIPTRIEQVTSELNQLNDKLQQLDSTSVADIDQSIGSKPARSRQKQRAESKIPGTRR